MSILKIVIYPNNILKTKCKKVKDFSKVQSLINNMSNTLDNSRGVGLAANQTGENKQIIVVKSEIYKDRILINPRILEVEGVIRYEEGCLSIPNYRAYIKRYNKITIEAFDREGDNIIEKFEGFESIVIQHEIDHLNGLTIIDRYGYSQLIT